MSIVMGMSANGSKAAIAAAAAALLAAHTPFTVAHAQMKDPAGWVVKTSPHDVAKTVTQLRAAVEKAGAKVFAVIDHQAGAQSVGLELDPATLVIFGNPKIGTPIMQANPTAGLDRPIRVLVWSEQGRTRVGALPPATPKDRYGADEAGKALTVMNKALENLLSAAAAA